jgi:hypothetical protein
MPNPTFGVYLGATPADTDGLRVLKAMATVDGTGRAALDLVADAASGGLRYAQAAYFDLADLGTNAVVTLTHRATGFRVRIKGGTQGWFPIATTDAMQFDIATTNVAQGVQIPLWFANFAAPNFQWPSV